MYWENTVTFILELPRVPSIININKPQTLNVHSFSKSSTPGTFYIVSSQESMPRPQGCLSQGSHFRGKTIREANIQTTAS